MAGIHMRSATLDLGRAFDGSSSRIVPTLTASAELGTNAHARVWGPASMPTRVQASTQTGTVQGTACAQCPSRHDAAAYMFTSFIPGRHSRVHVGAGMAGTRLQVHACGYAPACVRRARARVLACVGGKGGVGGRGGRGACSAPEVTLHVDVRCCFALANRGLVTRCRVRTRLRECASARGEKWHACDMLDGTVDRNTAGAG